MTNPASCRFRALGLVRKSRLRVAAIAAGLALAAPVMMVPGTAAADIAGRAAAEVAPPEYGRYFYLVARHSGKCLTVYQASQDDNAPLTQYTCVGQKNQQFLAQGGVIWGYFELQVRHSGRCVTVYQASKAEGAPINQYHCVDGANQLWRERTVPLYMALHSGLCMNVKGASQENNARIIQWRCGDYSNEKFSIRYVD